MKTRNKDPVRLTQNQLRGSIITTNRNVKFSANMVYSLKPEQYFLPKDIQLNSILSHMRRDAEENSLDLTNFSITPSNLRRRSVIMEKLKNFHKKYNLSLSTYYMAIFYLDLLIIKQAKLSVEKMGIGAFMLSMKYHDMDGRTPLLNKFSAFFGINQKELCRVEMESIKKLEYILTYSHIINFIQVISLYGIIYSDDGFTQDIIRNHVYDLPYTVVDYFIEENMKYLEFNPFSMALATICITRESLGIDKWNKAFNKYYKVNFSDIQEEYDFIKE